MAQPDTYDENNTTVRWVPQFLRDFLGLTGAETRPTYSLEDSDRQHMANQGVRWVPAAARRWLGLEFDENADVPTVRSGSSSYSAPRPTVPTYTPPAPTPAPAPAPTPAAASTAAPASTDQPGAPRFGTPTPAFLSSSTTYKAPGNDSGSGSDETQKQQPLAPRAEGYVQPVGQLVRSYLRGAMPPEGLEAFTRQLRKTTSDVWGMYSYWFRFQTEEFVDIGRNVVEGVIDSLPEGQPAPINKRIKVSPGNGGGKAAPEDAPAAVAAAPAAKPAEAPKPAAAAPAARPAEAPKPAAAAPVAKPAEAPKPAAAAPAKPAEAPKPAAAAPAAMPAEAPKPAAAASKPESAKSEPATPKAEDKDKKDTK
jgi:hypothetical protein